MYVLRILAKNLILPPTGLLILAAAGFAVRRRSARVGTGMIAAALALLAVVSMPVASEALMRAVDVEPALVPGQLPAGPGAIVILGGDVRIAPEYGGDDVGPISLERVRYGAWLHRATGGLPILATGGGLQDEIAPAGTLMARVLEDEFRVPVRWVETESRNTAENASCSAPLLRAAGVDEVYLVTSAFHMTRARAAFEAVGLRVVPAPTGGPPPGRGISVLDFVPTASSLHDSELALHEILGQIWYALVRAAG